MTPEWWKEHLEAENQGLRQSVEYLQGETKREARQRLPGSLQHRHHVGHLRPRSSGKEHEASDVMALLIYGAQSG